MTMSGGTEKSMAGKANFQVSRVLLDATPNIS
jgi:hypothetical protein